MDHVIIITKIKDLYVLFLTKISAFLIFYSLYCTKNKRNKPNLFLSTLKVLFLLINYTMMFLFWLDDCRALAFSQPYTVCINKNEDVNLFLFLRSKKSH